MKNTSKRLKIGPPIETQKSCFSDPNYLAEGTIECNYFIILGPFFWKGKTGYPLPLPRIKIHRSDRSKQSKNKDTKYLKTILKFKNKDATPTTYVKLKSIHWNQVKYIYKFNLYFYIYNLIIAFTFLKRILLIIFTFRLKTKWLPWRGGRTRSKKRKGSI